MRDATEKNRKTVSSSDAKTCTKINAKSKLFISKSCFFVFQMPFSVVSAKREISSKFYDIDYRASSDNRSL